MVGQSVQPTRKSPLYATPMTQCSRRETAGTSRQQESQSLILGHRCSVQRLTCPAAPDPAPPTAPPSQRSPIALHTTRLSLAQLRPSPGNTALVPVVCWERDRETCAYRTNRYCRRCSAASHPERACHSD